MNQRSYGCSARVKGGYVCTISGGQAVLFSSKPDLPQPQGEIQTAARWSGVSAVTAAASPVETSVTSPTPTALSRRRRVVGAGKHDPSHQIGMEPSRVLHDVRLTPNATWVRHLAVSPGHKPEQAPNHGLVVGPRLPRLVSSYLTSRDTFVSAIRRQLGIRRRFGQRLRASYNN